MWGRFSDIFQAHKGRGRGANFSASRRLVLRAAASFSVLYAPFKKTSRAFLALPKSPLRYFVRDYLSARTGAFISTR